MRGIIEDKALAARYRAWEKLPEGTLGRSLVDFYNKNGFAVPGERAGFPEAGLYHDFSHLLGELQHRAGGRDPGRRLQRRLQEGAAVLPHAVLRADLLERRADAADQATTS